MIPADLTEKFHPNLVKKNQSGQDYVSIDGGPHKRRSMWFNSMIREEPYLGLKVSDRL